MSDIFREVEEDVRREKFEKLWKTYGTHVIVLLSLALIGIAGFELWQRYETGERQKDATAFMAAQQVTNPKAAETAFAALAKTGHGGYSLLAKLEQANALAAEGQRDQAVSLYKDVANQDNGAVGAAARLRAGWVMADSAPHADLQTLLQPLLDPNSAWRQMAQEILAYSDYRAGKILLASAEFSKLASDPAATDNLRSRAHAFETYLSNGGATNYGSVPPPAPAAALPTAPADAATP